MSNSSTKRFFSQKHIPNLNQIMILPHLKSMGSFFFALREKFKLPAVASGHCRISLLFIVFISSLTLCSSPAMLHPHWPFCSSPLMSLSHYSVFPVLDCSTPDKPNNCLLIVINEVLTLMSHPVLQKSSGPVLIS